MVWLGPQCGVSQGCDPAVSQDPELSSVRLKGCVFNSWLRALFFVAVSCSPPSAPRGRPQVLATVGLPTKATHLAACPFKANKGARDAIRQVLQSCGVIRPSQPCNHIQHVMFCCWKQVTGPTLKGWITPGHEHQEVGIMYATLGVCPPQPQTAPDQEVYSNPEHRFFLRKSEPDCSHLRPSRDTVNTYHSFFCFHEFIHLLSKQLSTYHVPGSE